MKAEYQFDYRKARPNRFAGKGDGIRTVVELDDDVAVVFSNATTVNNALRALITAAPQVEYALAMFFLLVGAAKSYYVASCTV